MVSGGNYPGKCELGIDKALLSWLLKTDIVEGTGYDTKCEWNFQGALHGL